MPLETLAAPEAPGTASAAPAAPAASPRSSSGALFLIVLLLVAYTVGVWFLISYVKSPRMEAVKGIQGMEFVDLGELMTTVRVEGTPTVRYFRISVAVYLSGYDRETTKRMLERLRPKIKDEIQTIMMQETYSTLRQMESKRRIKDKIKDLLVQMLGPDRIDEVALPSYEPQ